MGQTKSGNKHEEYPKTFFCYLDSTHISKSDIAPYVHQ